MYKLHRAFFLSVVVSVIAGKGPTDISGEQTNLGGNFVTAAFGDTKNEGHISNVCRFRADLFPILYWNWKVGAECYFYNPTDWFIKKLRITSQLLTVDNVTYVIPFGLTEDNKPFGFDYTDSNSSNIVASSFKSDLFFRKWENCAKTGDACCGNVMNNENIYPSPEYPCPTTWDAWSCFSQAKSDSISEMPCPDYTSSSSDRPCILYSQKQCFADGTWNQSTDYSTCATAPVYRRRHSFHVTVLYVSIALTVPAVLIFTCYKNLRILRVNLHRNLLLACILRNIFTILTKELIILDALKSSKDTNNVMADNGVGCRILAYLSGVATNAIYACMLMDGFYLHKLIVRIFGSDPNTYIMHGVTAVLSILPTTIWAILMALEADDHCWTVATSWYQWIPDGFRIAILSVNIILLIDIIRVLVCKLKNNVSAQHTKYTYILVTNGISYNSVLKKACTSTFKAMIFLLPLFGVPFILTANRNIVDNDSCKAGDIFYYVSYSIQALQGIMVAVLFCYFNKEAQTQLKGTYRKLKLSLENRFGLKNERRQAVDRRETAATYVAHNNVIPKANRLDRNLPQCERNSAEKVNGWLAENDSTEEINNLPLNSIKDGHSSKAAGNTDVTNFSTPAIIESGFNGVDKFIDSSTESLKT